MRIIFVILTFVCLIWLWVRRVIINAHNAIDDETTQ